MKRSQTPEISTESPAKKQARNRSLPSSLSAPVSPPTKKRPVPNHVTRDGGPPVSTSQVPSSIGAKSPAEETTTKTSDSSKTYNNEKDSNDNISLAAIEAGLIKVPDPVSIFSSRLAQAAAAHPPLPPGPGESSPPPPRISHSDWMNLYLRNQHPHGHHFVVHQHDHPVAGPHYDLRLQISETSSVSWAVMYGLPGDPNSRRVNRNATETRVHCLWNHLIETASTSTGSMLIWDTGEYSVLPYRTDEKAPETDDSCSETSEDSFQASEEVPENEKLKEAFRNRKIRLRLHGTRLPPSYTITMRLTSLDNNPPPLQPRKIPRKRRRRAVSQAHPSSTPSSTSSSSASPSPPPDAATETPKPEPDTLNTSTEESEDEKTRLTNAYPGATNSVGSIHQRRWFITLDRENSGFEPIPSSPSSSKSAGKGKKTWVRKKGENGKLLGFEPFYVRGPEVERSVVTGRWAREVLEDEGVEGFVRRRRGWRAILE